MSGRQTRLVTPPDIAASISVSSVARYSNPGSRNLAQYPAASNPELIAGTGMHWGVVTAFIAVIFAYILLQRHLTGFHIKLTGQAPRAARFAGVSPARLVTLAKQWNLPDDRPVLVDCLTLWLTNQMLAERDVETETAALVDVLCRPRGFWAVVSNEVGLGIVPENALARRFRDAAGRLHRGAQRGADTSKPEPKGAGAAAAAAQRGGDLAGPGRRSRLHREVCECPPLRRAAARNRAPRGPRRDPTARRGPARGGRPGTARAELGGVGSEVPPDAAPGLQAGPSPLGLEDEDEAPGRNGEHPPTLLVIKHVRASDVGGHEVRRELHSLESHVENPSERRDHECLRQARNTLEKAVPSREDGSKELLDHVGLADDHFLELVLHEPPVLGKLLEDVVECLGAGCSGHAS